MKSIAYCGLFLVHFIFAMPALALDTADFNQAEYAFSLNEPESLDMAPGTLSGERAGYYDFIRFEPGRKEKLVTYLDTPDRQFRNKALIVRVREDLKKPWKSKITVKLRTPSPGQFGDLKKYSKAEIDVQNGQKKYSVSYDIKFDPNNIDVRKVDMNAVFARIRKKSPQAWALVEPVFTEHAGRIQQTIVMRALSWEGTTTAAGEKMEVDYAVWSPYYKYPKTFVSELSYKLSTSNAKIEKIARQIKDTLEQKAILSDSYASKTSKTFELSPNFN